MDHPSPSEIFKMIRDGPKNTQENFNQVLSSIQKIISGYDQDDILYWLSALSIFPGNEIYEKRFEFLLQIVLSNHLLNGKKKVSKKLIKKLLDRVENLNWIMFEDWTPIKLDSQRKIYFRNNQYSFFPTKFEFPENVIETISRFSVISDQFEEKIGYSPSKELTKVLAYQNDIIRFIFNNLTDYETHKKIILPPKSFVKKWKEYNSKKILPFSKHISSQLSITEVKKPSLLFFEGQSLLRKYPIHENAIYLPSQLLYTFLIHMREDYTKISNNQNQEILNTQVKMNILLSFLEIAPLEAILTDFKINDIDEKIDFGIIHDDKFYFFYLLDDVSIRQDLTNSIKKSQDLKIKLIHAFKDGKIHIFDEDIPDNLEPIFIHLLDDSLITEPIVVDYEFTQPPEFLIPLHCLRHILEDIADKEEDLTLLAKILNKYRSLAKETIVIQSNFCDFYEMAQLGYLFPKDGIIMVDPHVYPKQVNDKLIQRPRMDLTPNLEYPPFNFRMLKIGEKQYYGYNRFLNHVFFVFLGNFQIFLVMDMATCYSSIEIDVGVFLSSLYSFIIEQIDSNELLKKGVTNKTIRLIPINFAQEQKVEPINDKPCQVLRSIKNDDEFILIYDAEEIVDKINIDFDVIIVPFLSIIEKLCDHENIEEIIDILLTLNLKDKFRISKIHHYASVKYIRNINYPTIMDEIDVETMINKFVKGRYKDGIYYKNDANNIIKNIALYIKHKIIKVLETYDLESFIRLSYSENENVIMTGIRKDMEFLSRKDMIINYDPIQEIIDHQEKRNWYAPSCRYLLETRMSMKKNGTKKITIYEWKILVALTKKYLYLINLSDFFYYLSIRADYLDIKLELSTKNSWVFRPIFEENPFIKYNKEIMEGRMLTSLEEEYPSNIEELDIEEIFKRGEDLFDKKEFIEIDAYLQENFGFKQLEYGLVLNSITHLHEIVDSDYLIKINRDELIDFLYNKIKLSKLTISNIIDFSTLSPHDITKPPEYGKINTRRYRLTIKPLIRLNENLIFGISTVVTCATQVIRQLTSGEWPYSYEDETFPRKLKNKLIQLSGKTSSNFEDAVYASISKHTPFIEKNICKNLGKNDKCLETVDEPCIGEIDIFSLHPKSRKAIVWEVKKIEQKFGSREISYDVEEFLSDKGYLTTLRNKQDYVKRNLEHILKYYTIKDTENWTVESVFVFSSLSILKFIVSQHHSSILWDEIESYLHFLNII